VISWASVAACVVVSVSAALISISVPLEVEKLTNSAKDGVTPDFKQG
jgi:hypothetical protein